VAKKSQKGRKGAPGKKKKANGNSQSLPILHADTAGVDIGAMEIYVAVPADRDEHPVRCFGTFTDDLRKIAQWLKQCNIKRVAMESTGVYWIPLWQILSDESFELCLVNARHFKNVPGKKTDVQDCQWLQFLHSVGLLRGSHRPDEAICGLRTLLRYRGELVKSAAMHLQHMHKSLEEMNIKLGHVLSELQGVTGLVIVDALLAGERDLKKLAQLRDGRVRASEETIMKSLEGDYRVQHLITLQFARNLYQHYQTLIELLDREMEAFMSQLPDRVDLKDYPLPASQKKTQPKRQHNAPAYDLRTQCYRVLGVDLTAIDGIDAVTAHVVLTEVGADLSEFPTAAHFCSWLRLCPNNEMSGGRTLSKKTKKGKNRLALALRHGASTLHASQTPLGQYLRRMKARFGPARAITVTAHKIARIIYHMITLKEAFKPEMLDAQDARQKRKHEAIVRKHAMSLGFQLIPLVQPSA